MRVFVWAFAPGRGCWSGCDRLRAGVAGSGVPGLLRDGRDAVRLRDEEPVPRGRRGRRGLAEPLPRGRAGRRPGRPATVTACPPTTRSSTYRCWRWPCGARGGVRRGDGLRRTRRRPAGPAPRGGADREGDRPAVQPIGLDLGRARPRRPRSRSPRRSWRCSGAVRATGWVRGTAASITDRRSAVSAGRATWSRLLGCPSCGRRLPGRGAGHPTADARPPPKDTRLAVLPPELMTKATTRATSTRADRPRKIRARDPAMASTPMPSATARTANQAASTHRRASDDSPGARTQIAPTRTPSPPRTISPGCPSARRVVPVGGYAWRTRAAPSARAHTPMMSTAVSAPMLGLVRGDDADQEGDAATHHQHRAAKAESMQIHKDLLTSSGPGPDDGAKGCSRPYAVASDMPLLSPFPSD